MASLFTAQYDAIYEVVLDDGKTISIEFSRDNYLYSDEECNENDCHECYNIDNRSRYVIYTRDVYDDIKKQTLTYITLTQENGQEYDVSEMYLDDELVYSDNMLIYPNNLSSQ